jgi:hypothetical protein
VVYSTIQTSDGGFAIAGGTSSFGAGKGDLLILKMDSLGNLAWTRTFGGTGSDWAISMVQAPDGGFVVAGTIYGLGAGGYDILVTKLSASGDIEWARAYGTTEWESAASIVQASGGGYLVGGGISGGAIILRIDSLGNPIWVKAFEEFLCPDAFSFSMIQTPDGGYAIAGGFNDWPPYFSDDFQVIKMDSLGNMEWARTYGDTAYEHPYCITLTSDGGFVIGGDEWTFMPGPSRLLLVRIDSSGEMIQTRVFGDTGTQYSRSVIRATDGGYVVAGGMSSTYGTGGSDFLVMKLDTAGNYPDCVEPYTIPSRNVSPTVTTPSLVVTVCSLAVDTPNLTITTPVLTITDVCPPVVAEEAGAPPSGSLTLLPAPSGFWITGYSGEARIYDPAGRLVLSKEIKGKTLISPLSPGVYFVVAGKERARIAVR